MLPFLSADFIPLLNNKNVYCGFSGGPDSLTLLLLLFESQEAFHFTLNAVHFEHGLRGRAGVDDSLFCQEFCQKRNIPFTCISLNVPEHIQQGESVESAARRMRLDYWKKLPGNSIVALGHNADDLAENLFLRLMRGSNVSALTSLTESSVYENITFIRPLLSYPRTAIETFLQGRGQIWRTDATNAESDYSRNFLRNKILPELYSKFPYGKEGIVRSLKNLQSDAEFIDNQAVEIYNSMNPYSREDWLKLAQAVFCRVFRLFLSEKIGKTVISGHQLLSRFETELKNPPGQGYSELIITDYPEFSLFIGKKDIFLINHQRTEPVIWNPIKLQVAEFRDKTYKADLKSDVIPGKGNDIAVFDRKGVSFPLIIRQSCQGDKMTAFGKKNPVSVKKFLSDAAVPEPLRINYPVLCDSDGDIIWIPGIKRSNKAPAQSDSENLTISFL